MAEKMSPVEIMAKAHWDNRRTEELAKWDDLEPSTREEMIDDMRAALRALAECEQMEPARHYIEAAAAEGETP